MKLKRVFTRGHVVCSFVVFHLAIGLSVLPLFTDFDYLFSIFNHFFHFLLPFISGKISISEVLGIFETHEDVVDIKQYPKQMNH